MIHATDFSYQAFRSCTRAIEGHRAETAWIAVVGPATFPVRSESEWHRTILHAQQVELLQVKWPSRLSARTAISFLPAGRKRKLDDAEDSGDGQPPRSRPSTCDRTNTRSPSPRHPPGDPMITADDFLEALKGAAMGTGLYGQDALDGVPLADVAHYFGVPLNGVGEIRLPGTRQDLHLHQALFVYHYLRRLLNEEREELRGQVLSDEAGLGKIRCCLALMAELRAIEINAEHVRANPGRHLAPGDGNDGENLCPMGGPRAAECVCVSGSIRSRWARRLFGGPSLVVAPSGCLPQWSKEANDYFYPYVDEAGQGHESRGDGSLTEFIIPYVWAAGFKGHDSTKADFRYEVFGELNLRSEGGGARRPDYDEFTDLLTMVRDPDLAPHTARDRGLRVHVSGRVGITPGSKLLLLSLNAVRRKGNGNIFSKLDISTTLLIRREGKAGTSRKLSWTPGFAPTLVVIDESHECARRKDLIWMMERILAVTLCEEEGVTRVPLWLFASATPWNDSLSNADVWLPFIYPQTESVEEKRKAIGELAGQRRELQVAVSSNGEMDLEGLARLRDRVQLLLGPMTIARRKDTPMGVGRVVSAPTPDTNE